MSSELSTTTSTFAELGVDESIVSALSAAGIEKPFPIQELAIPIAIIGTDLIGQARTGTGKTFAFGIPVLQRVVLEGDDEYEDLEAPGKPQALIMTPTRELALQVSNDIEIAARNRRARVITIYGGVSYDEQLKALTDGVDIVVGTPGRLLDLANRKALDLSHISILVLDEADEMMDLGFLPDVENLLGRTPSDRQTMLFSATMPSQIVALSRNFLTLPIYVRAEGEEAQTTVPDTKQFIYQAHDLDKPEMIGKILQADGVEKTMIFTHTKRSAGRLLDELTDRGFKVGAIHGDLSQDKRERTLRRFRKGELTVLVATDVAARGIDVTGVSHVINYECPDDPKNYVHRIGRTGRAGAKGVAVTFVDWADVTKWRIINKALDLGMPDPVETYSTSPHFFENLHIDPSVKSRLVDAKPAEERQRPERGDRQRGGRDRRPREEQSSEKREPKARQNRNRRRTRNGQVVGQQTAEQNPAAE